MAAPMKTGMPVELDLPAGYTLRFTALDPTTGAANTDVVVSSAAITAEPVGGTQAGQLEVGPFMLVPGPES
jgi:hypothetical protein